MSTDETTLQATIARQLEDAKLRGEGMLRDGPDKRLSFGEGIYFTIEGSLVDRGLQGAADTARRGAVTALHGTAALVWDGMRVAQLEAEELKRRSSHKGTFGGITEGHAERLKLVHAYSEPWIQPFDDDLEPLKPIRDKTTGFVIGPVAPRDGGRILRVDWACKQTELSASEHHRTTLHIDAFGSYPARKKTWRLRHVDQIQPFVVREILRHQEEHHAGRAVSVESRQVEGDARDFVCMSRSEAVEGEHVDEARILRLTTEIAPPQTFPLEPDEPFVAFVNFPAPLSRIDYLLLVWED